MRKVRIFVAGHRGMVGSKAIVKLLRKNKKNKEIITKEKHNLDLINQDMVKKFLKGKNDQVCYCSQGGLNSCK